MQQNLSVIAALAVTALVAIVGIYYASVRKMRQDRTEVPQERLERTVRP